MESETTWISSCRSSRRSASNPILRRFGRREGVRAGRSIPQAQSDLLGHLGAASQARDRAAIGKGYLCCNATGARAPNAAARFPADRYVDLGGRKLAQYDGGEGSGDSVPESDVMPGPWSNLAQIPVRRFDYAVGPDDCGRAVGRVCSPVRRNSHWEMVMAKVIKFYIPSIFRKPLKGSSQQHCEAARSASCRSSKKSFPRQRR